MVKDCIKNIYKIFQNAKIKYKILFSLLFVSLLSIGCVSAVNLVISSGIVTDNSENMADNIILQISYNLDERISQFESLSYSFSKANAVTNILRDRKIDHDYAAYQNASRKLSDMILQNTMLYQYTNHILIKPTDGIVYSYDHSSQNIAENAEATIDLCKKKVNKIHPVNWTIVNGTIVFVRLVIDNRNYQEKGILCFCLKPSFFDFILQNRGIVSNKNLIILNNANTIMINNGYNLRDEQLHKILSTSSNNHSINNYRVPYNNKQCLITEVLTKKDWKILSVIKISDLLEKNRLIFLFVVIIAAFFILISVCITLLITRGIMSNLSIMKKSMKRVEKGDFKVRIKPAGYDEIGMLGLSFNNLVSKMEDLIQSVVEEKNAKRDAEFQALQAQINPHFLYNTLGSVKWYANRKKQYDIEHMIDSLILLLRQSIKKANSFQTIREEVDLIKSYLEIQKMRYGDVFSVTYSIEEGTCDNIILGFLLQPLVENALYHGLDLSGGNGMIWIRAFKRSGRLVLQVEDNGCGFSKERLAEVMNRESKYEGFNSIGLKIVTDRLKAYYGEDFDFSIESDIGSGTLISMELPDTKVLTEALKQHGI